MKDSGQACLRVVCGRFYLCGGQIKRIPLYFQMEYYRNCFVKSGVRLVEGLSHPFLGSKIYLQINQ